MANRKAIYTPSAFYKGLRFYVRIGFSCYFRQIEYRGWENIPPKEAVIFAPNHQCAIMDALAVLLWQKDPVIFMARADIFQNKFAAKLLRIIKMMPVYRIRDGYNNLSKNEALFQEACQVLTTHHSLCLMPEGNQGNQRHLRPLVKGLFRIAFSAQASMAADDGVKIVPVGIDYTDYIHSGGDLSLTFGPAIAVSDYMDSYRENQVEGYNELRSVLAGKLSAMIQDIRHTEHYEAIYQLSYWMMPAYNNRCHAADTPASRLDARKAITVRLEKIIESDPSLWQQLMEASERLRSMPGNINENVTFIQQKESSVFSLLWDALLYLVSLPGRIINWPVLLLIQRILKSVEDTQMHATIRIVIALIFYPLFYLIITVLAAVLSGMPFLMAVMTFLLCGLAGLLTEKIRPYARKRFHRIKYLFGKRKIALRALRKDFADFSKLCDQIFR